MSQSDLPDIIIFGATHVGLRLAARLADGRRRVLLIDRPAEPPEAPRGWEYASGDYTVPENVACARRVYAVTDEDRLNIRIALAVRSACADVPVVITLVQSQLGHKLARHLPHFSFVNPPELAARKFVDAVYAPAPRPPGNVAPAAEPAAEIVAPRQIDPLVLRAVLTIATLGLLATIYFHFAESLSWVDAAYFVVTLMATVGFGDISLKDASTLSKVVGMLLMVASVTNTAVIFALVTDSLLRRRLALSFGSRRVRASDHVIVVGAGSVGLKVVEELLKRGERVVVIDAQAGGRYLPAIRAKRVPTLIGDAKFERTLRDAGLPRARALISVTNDDLANLEIGLNARLLAPTVRLVLRIYDQQLAQSLSERLDIHFAFSMSSVAAGVLSQPDEAGLGPHAHS